MKLKSTDRWYFFGVVLGAYIMMWHYSTSPKTVHWYTPLLWILIWAVIYIVADLLGRWSARRKHAKEVQAEIDRLLDRVE